MRALLLLVFLAGCATDLGASRAALSEAGVDAAPSDGGPPFAWPIPSGSAPIDVFYFGQSNVYGVNYFDEFSYDELALLQAAVDPATGHVWGWQWQELYSAAWGSYPTNKRWLPLQQQGQRTTGSEITIGRELHDLTGADVRIQRFARGGTSLYEWWDWAWENPASQSAYNRIWWATNHARAIAANVPSGWAPTYCVWQQGESDARDPADAAGYEQRLGDFLDQFQADWAADWGGGPCALVIVTLGADQSAANAYAGDVRLAQLAVGAARADAVVVDADAMVTADGTHWDATSTLAIGRAVAHAIATGSDQAAGAFLADPCPSPGRCYDPCQSLRRCVQCP